MQPLIGARQSYEWGSTTSMFKYLGKDPDGNPFAELWLGAHPLAPAMIDTATQPAALNEVIDQDPKTHLGEEVSSAYGRLPYLVKLLAPARPLSIQVHPSPSLAKTGFQSENEQGLPVTHPHRSFKDEHHKPEMVYAITSFEGLAGFRPLTEVASVLEAIGGPVWASVAGSSGSSATILQQALEHLLGLDKEETDQITKKCLELADGHPDPDIKVACQTVKELSAIYPGDIGAVVSLLLNRVRLQPGQLLFIGDGVPHAYLGGFGLEVMANSDNVLRLGLTSKHIDVPSTLEALDFSTSGYAIETTHPNKTTHIFKPPVDEFALSVSQLRRSTETIELPGNGPRILVCLQGMATVSTQLHAQSVELHQGEACFISATEGRAFVSGTGQLAEVFVP